MGAGQTKPEPVIPVPVTLHIYDFGTSAPVQGLNDALRATGTGAFHCAVEVYGVEWSYGYCDVWETGVFKFAPKQNDDHSYRESVDMGVCTMSEQEVHSLIEWLKSQWMGPAYDLLERNCTHFSDTFCRQLGVGPIPAWIGSLAGTGAGMAQAGRWVSARKKSWESRILGQISFMMCSVVDQRERAESIAVGKRARGATEDDADKLGDFSRGLYRRMSEW